MRARRDVVVTLVGWSQGLLSPEGPAAVKACGAGDLVVGDLHEIDCVLNGRGFRVLLEPGALLEKIGRAWRRSWFRLCRRIWLC